MLAYLRNNLRKSVPMITSPRAPVPPVDGCPKGCNTLIPFYAKILQDDWELTGGFIFETNKS